MGRRKRNSVALEKAINRLASLNTISPTLDLGNGLTLAIFIEKTDEVKNKIETHNSLLSALDASGIELHDMEKKLADLTERMLAGVAAHYGKDSPEYQMAGGVRKSERKRFTRKPDPAAAEE